MSGKRWTEEEESAWRAFFTGTGPIPRGRNLHCALRRMSPSPIADLGELSVAHATSAAAMRHLSNVPWKREADPVKFIEAVQACAVEPWRYALTEHPWPDEVFEQAIIEAREAISHV